MGFRCMGLKFLGREWEGLRDCAAAAIAAAVVLCIPIDWMGRLVLVLYVTEGASCPCLYLSCDQEP